MLPSLLYSLLAVAATTVAFATPNPDETLAEFLSLPAQEPSIEPWVHQRSPEDFARHQDTPDLQARRYRVNQFSYIVSRNNLVTWIFGNYTHDYNISIASCVKMSDVAGVYEFANGSTKYDATIGDIAVDLTQGTDAAARASNAAQTLKNAILAVDETQAYLDEDVLVPGTSIVHRKTRRDITFRSEGRILALITKTMWGTIFGIALVQITAAFAGIKASYGQLAAGAIGGAGYVSAYTIVDILTDEGALTGLEPDWMEKAAIYVCNIFMAKLRALVMLFRGDSEINATGPRYTESELTATLENMDAYSAWNLETTPLSEGGFNIEGICDQV